jgi:hypothetical protein
MNYPDEILSDDARNIFDLLQEDEAISLPEILDRVKDLQEADDSFSNARVKNLVSDIKDLQRDVKKLHEHDSDPTWPAEYFQRYFDIIKTSKRLGIT